MQADASGSLEALKAALNTLPQERVSLRFLHAAAGPVTAADVDLAAAAEGALVIAFNTPVSEAVLASAKNAREWRPQRCILSDFAHVLLSLSPSMIRLL